MATPRKIHIEDIKILKAQGLNQAEIATRLGCTQSGVSKVATQHGLHFDIGAAAHDQSGQNNPNYKDGMGRSTIERLTRRVVIASGRNPHVCERCGDESFPNEQNRHHKDRNRSNNTAENIEVLCISCHNEEHGNDRVRNEKGQYA